MLGANGVIRASPKITGQSAPAQRLSPNVLHAFPTKLRHLSAFGVLTIITALVEGACGGSTDATAPIQDSGSSTTDVDAEAGIVDDPLDPSYPAAHAPIPPVDFNGGRIMTSPKIVTVTFDGDGMRDRLEAFGDVMTTTPWWDAVTEGYCNKGGTPCIGHGVAVGHVHLSTPPDARVLPRPHLADDLRDLFSEHREHGERLRRSAELVQQSRQGQPRSVRTEHSRLRVL